MSKHVLLVSYDERLLIARRKLLEQEGYRVFSGLTFREAIAVCKRGLGVLLVSTFRFHVEIGTISSGRSVLFSDAA